MRQLFRQDFYSDTVTVPAADLTENADIWSWFSVFVFELCVINALIVNILT